MFDCRRIFKMMMTSFDDIHHLDSCVHWKVFLVRWEVNKRYNEHVGAYMRERERERERTIENETKTESERRIRETRISSYPLAVILISYLCC